MGREEIGEEEMRGVRRAAQPSHGPPRASSCSACIPTFTAGAASLETCHLCCLEQASAGLNSLMPESFFVTSTCRAPLRLCMR